ncbi:protein kinase [Nocardia yamanashiensis]|uniref:serine/threonine-protein kinase n=1 Tax=Nocardia yamanashiensis TaxID=209247 RepID=UPI001E6114E9|nr:serine/threonine-protein kinase [Nocardia yamanashiensis]UGT38579.1 protein kinase [Nocardia yamanashiensis]
MFAGYVIERELGRGGMGSVYLAKHPRLPRMTALKLLNQEMFSDNEIRARFVREADLVAQLDHPNIVTVYDRGTEGEQLWISMQYIDGVNASAVNPGSLPPLRAAQIITETAKALDYAHGRGVLHRDVKPANILLARSSNRAGAGGERVYLTDFGIARLRDDTGHLTQTGTVTATLAYASPEQLTGATMDGRSDQYALACTLFQLLTGAVPFEGTSPAAVIRGHLQQPPPPASPLRPELPRPIDGVLGRALAKRPQDRFRSCVEFAAAVERALAAPRPPTPAHPQPIVPRPPTPIRPQPIVQQPRPPVGPVGQSGPAQQPRPIPQPGPNVPVGQGQPLGPSSPVGQGQPLGPNTPIGPGPQLGPNPQVSQGLPLNPNPAMGAAQGVSSGRAPQVGQGQRVNPGPVYQPPQNFQQRPPVANYRAPQRSSSPVGWIIFGIVAVIVTAIIVIAIIVNSNKSSSLGPATPTITTLSLPAAGPYPA